MSAFKAEGRPTQDRTAFNTTPTIIPRLIGATVETELENALWQLVKGEIELHHLTPALQAWWAIAHSDGYAAGYATTNAWLLLDRDRWYFVASNPGKKPGDYLGHLTSRMWDEAYA